MRSALLATIAACSFEHGTAPGADGALAVPDDGQTVQISPRKKQITIDYRQVVGAHQLFPLWIDVTDRELQVGARHDGRDLFFTDATGRPLPYEIAGWDAATGHLSAWVGLPELSPSTGLLLYLRYGALDNVPPPSPSDVFSRYAAVWHLDDALATASVADAIGTTPGTAIGLDAHRAVPGRLGGAFDFNGQDTTVAFDNMLLGGTPHAISAWVNQRTRQGYEALVVVGSSSTDDSRWLFTAFDAPSVAVGLFDDNVALSGPPTDLEGAGWSLVDWVFDGVDESRIYIDGVALGTFVHPYGWAHTVGSSGWIGWAPPGWGNAAGLNGQIDEVRIAKGIPSDGWIATEFANQKAGSTLVTIGPAQPVL